MRSFILVLPLGNWQSWFWGHVRHQPDQKCMCTWWKASEPPLFWTRRGKRQASRAFDYNSSTARWLPQRSANFWGLFCSSGSTCVSRSMTLKHASNNTPILHSSGEKPIGTRLLLSCSIWEEKKVRNSKFFKCCVLVERGLEDFASYKECCG